MCKISIVIATLGGVKLNNTIKLLNKGSLIPNEILVCIPVSSKFNENFNYSNVRIIRTLEKGQVSQRIEGFKQVENEFVLQIDDDICVENDFLKNLYNLFITLPENSAIAPSFIFLNSSHHVYPISNGWLNKIYYYLINGRLGYQQGVITMSGTEIGVNASFSEKILVESEWLPGGCVLHRKKNLILSNYFPFAGKAFCEDLFHSCELKKIGLKLFVSTKVYVEIDDPRNDVLTFKNQIFNLLSDYKIRSFFCKKYKSKTINFYIYYLLRFNSILLKKIF